MKTRSQTENKAGSGALDMLDGPLLRNILLFAAPLIASGILQQSFNAADVVIIGRYVNRQALAAVGSNGPIINLIITLFVGLSVGVNVVIAHYIGRRDERGIRNSVSTSAVLAVASGLFLLIVGQLAARPMLEVLGTPHDVLEMATIYLRIFFLGMPFLMIYNFGAAILRSIGDTRRPFYSLLAAGCVNIGLNVLFVAGMGMTVDGVAIATVTANGVNAAITVYFLMREHGAIRLDLKTLKITRIELKKILSIGFPAGLQGMVFSISNVFILSAINSFGSEASAGSAAALNYEIYSYFIMTAFVQATVAFTSQNYAAGNIDRCRRIFRLNMLMSVAGTVLFSLLVLWRRDLFISLFSTDPEIYPYASVRITYVLVLQFIACSYEISGAAMRGLGYSMTPTVLTIFGTCVLRLLWVWMLPRMGGGFRELMIIYPVSWAITGSAVYLAYLVVRRRAYAVYDKNTPTG